MADNNTALGLAVLALGSSGGGGQTYSAGNGIDITSNVISADFTNSDTTKAVANKKYVDDSVTGFVTLSEVQDEIDDRVTGASTGTSTNEISYLTVGDTEYKLSSGGGSSYTFTNGLTESSGTVSSKLFNRVKVNEDSYPTSTSNDYLITMTANDSGQTSSTNYGRYSVQKTTGGLSVAITQTSGKSNVPVLSLSNSTGANLVVGDMSSTVITNNSFPVYVDNIGAVIGDFSASSLNAYNIGIRASGLGTLLGGYAVNANNSMYVAGNGSLLWGYADANASSYTRNDYVMQSTANGSVALNYGTQAKSNYQTAIGKFNVPDTSSTYAFIIGNGTGHAARSNAMTVDWNGNITANNIPAAPSTDGNYVLKCTISSGTASYSWVAE